jgi:hypothetical protein
VDLHWADETVLYVYGEQTHKYQRPYFLLIVETIVIPESQVTNMLKIKSYQVMNMTNAYRLAASILESNGLTVVISDILLKVKHTVYLITNHIQSVHVECTLCFNNYNSQMCFWIMFQTELAYNPQITVFL